MVLRYKIFNTMYTHFSLERDGFRMELGFSPMSKDEAIQEVARWGKNRGVKSVFIHGHMGTFKHTL